jgi:hypothetical protein
MTAGDLTLRPLLSRHPDARRAKAPLLQPILLPYLALIFGSGVAALAACYNALMMRRGGLAARSLLAGAGGTIAFLVVAGNAIHFGAETVVAIILGRVVHFAFGGLLFSMQRPHIRGNEFLGGPMAPLLPSYLAAIAISLLLPSPLTLLLLGVPLAG